MPASQMIAEVRGGEANVTRLKFHKPLANVLTPRSQSIVAAFAPAGDATSGT
jgi:hypothetical protein